MTALDRLKRGLVVLGIDYADGSVVKFLTTLNEEELHNRGIKMDEDDLLIDLDTLKSIPDTLLERVCFLEEVDKEGKKYDSELDEYLEEGAKICW